MKYYVIGESLLTGKKVVHDNEVGAALFRIVENAPDERATAHQIMEKLSELESEGNGLGVKSAQYRSDEHRPRYIGGYLTWLVKNENFTIDNVEAPAE